MLYDAERRITGMRQRGVEYSDVGEHSDPFICANVGLTFRALGRNQLAINTTWMHHKPMF